MKKVKILMLSLLMFLFTSVFTLASENLKSVSADVAIGKLVEGNTRFVDEKYLNNHISADFRKELTKGQHPFAVIVTCSDSRVSPEIVFDQGLGDLFVIRTAGEVVDELEIGSIEYAVEHLGVKLVVVLGHESCGAVSAAVSGGEMPKNIAAIIEQIKPAVEKAKGQKGSLIDNAIINNVDLVINKINTNSDVLKETKDVKVVGAVYNLTNSKVEFLKK